MPESCILELATSGENAYRYVRADSIGVGQSGESARLQMCLVDVTPQLEAQREIRALNAELEARVEERTLELTRANAELRREVRERKEAEAQLAQSRKLEAIGRLAGGLAHDLNNVMSVISMNATFLQSAMGPGNPLREIVDELVESAERAVALPKQLLTFARRQPEPSEPVEFGVTLTSIGSMLARLLGEARITLEMASEDGLWVLLGKSQQEQLIINLVLNARDVMPRGGILERNSPGTESASPSRNPPDSSLTRH